ncbi:small ribosomal subunit Rsm22 family protein [Herpetosiphon giganteus]|uniref:small ribosomal subunit Rsm22 family protein n=1 Tax=Herpetosiphon giganteus TaxID=2029754 RepID=UPI00195D503B|nr:small ribosomal subunit Rsm22 family protein [Herpetosiphon giganteus]MBM7842384.1 ribosomal protein RSM22 (predicted rRNA methylase) [Herpetosiphon giganteus]
MLPPALRVALERELTGTDQKRLATAASGLSERYREGHSRTTAPFVQNAADVLAYAATRMPATLGALKAACSEIAQRQPNFKPQTQLDLGAGTGAATWAASLVWPTLQQHHLLERESTMLQLGQRLMQAGPSSLQKAAWQQANLPNSSNVGSYDLVTIGYVLGELNATQRQQLFAQAWQATSGSLLIVEPGTPRGFELILAAREFLLGQQAHLIAPCPHQTTCPMQTNDWCHFATRIERTRFHRSLKGAELGYEDEKWSYIAVSRQPTQPAPARIIRHPFQQPQRIQLQLCTPQGLINTTINKRDAQWKAARKAEWGDSFEPHLAQD